MNRTCHLRDFHRLGFASLGLLLGLMPGCHTQPPGGAPIQPTTLGATVDEANRLQEENAESAKLIVYVHEFEINLQHEPLPTLSEKGEQQGFRYEPSWQLRGIRLTPDGQDHVRRIARMFLQGTCPPNSQVVLERSQTSKHWDTKHHYPVHFNDELDSVRREVLVRILDFYGVPNSDQLVVVAPAFPTGLSADEAAAAYDNTTRGWQNNNRGRR